MAGGWKELLLAMPMLGAKCLLLLFQGLERVPVLLSLPPELLQHYEPMLQPVKVLLMLIQTQPVVYPLPAALAVVRAVRLQ
jgi:hypothetical protein